MKQGEYCPIDPGILNLPAGLKWADVVVPPGLLADVATRGVQRPICVLVEYLGDNEYNRYVLDGAKRVQAAIRCDLSEVPANVFENVSPVTALELHRESFCETCGRPFYRFRDTLRKQGEQGYVHGFREMLDELGCNCPEGDHEHTS